MSEGADLRFAAGESARVWLFALDLAGDELDRFAAAPVGDAVWPLEDALGAGPLDPAGIEILDLGADADGLAALLEREYGVAPGEAARLRLAGPAMVITASALGAREGAFRPQPPVRHVATFDASRSRRRKRPSEAALSGRVAMGALLVAFALVGVMVAFSG